MVYFKEALPNPAGEDVVGEWVRLINTGDSSVDLAGWAIRDASGKTYTLTLNVEPKTEIVLERSATGISLNNDSETLTLTDKEGRVVDSLSYSQASDDEIIVAERFLLSEETGDQGAKNLDELALNGGRTISGGEASAIAIAVLVAVASSIFVGLFIKRENER